MLQRFSTLLLLPILTENLSTEEYGVYALLVLLGTIAQPVFGLGLNGAMGPQYFKASCDLARRHVTWTALAIAAMSAWVLMLISWAMPGLLLKCVLLDEAYSVYASLLLTGTAVAIVSSPLTQRIQFEEKARRFFVISMSSTLATVVLSLVGVVIWKHGVLALIYAQLAGNLISLLLGFLFAKMKGRPVVSRKIMFEILKVGLPLVPSFAFLFIMANAGKYALQGFHGESTLGIYTVGFQLGTSVNMVVGALATAWYPFFMKYHARVDEATELFGRLTRYYAVMIGFVCLCLFALADVLMFYLVNESYYDARKIIAIVGAAYAISGFFNLFLPPLYFGERVAMITPIQMLAAICAIVLAVLLCPGLEELGASMSMLGGYLLMAMTLFLYNCFSSSISLKIRYDYGRIARFGLMAMIIALMSRFSVSAGSILFYAKPLVLITASGFAVWFTLLRQERQYLRSRLLNPFSGLRNI